MLFDIDTNDKDALDTMFKKLVELSARYDYGTSWYENGIKSLKDEFRVEYIANNVVVITNSANSNYRKTYLIDIDGLKSVKGGYTK